VPATSDERDGTRCPHCRRWVPFPLKRCRRRQCPGYSRIWAGDQRRKLFANLDAYADLVPADAKEPQVLLTAVTAPGAGPQLRWDERHCEGLGDHTHSGTLGCRVHPWDAGHWNRTAAERWRLLHGEAYRRCVREGLKPWLLTRVWELQKRGMLHAHPVLAYSTPKERLSARRYLEHLDELRHRYGFGFIERKRLVREPRAAAAYLSSYFVTGKDQKVKLEESVRSNAMPRSIIHVSNKLTQRTGLTMRSLRLKRYVWVLRRQIEQYWEYVAERPEYLEDELDRVRAQVTRGP
jgi:hypothetical protein